MDRMITKTLAEIYLKQGDLRKAYEIFKVLSEQDPSDKEVQAKLTELSERLGLSPPLNPFDEIALPREKFAFSRKCSPAFGNGEKGEEEFGS